MLKWQLTGGGGAQSSCQEKRQQSCRNAGKSELELTNLRHNNSLENVDSSLKSVDGSSQGIDSSSQNFESYPENVGRFSRNIDNSSLNFGSFSQIFGNFSQNLKKHIHRCKLWTQFPANFAALFKVRLAATFLPFAAAFTTTLTSSLLAAVVNRRFINSLKIILLQTFFLISSLRKMLRNCLICETFRDFLASFGRSALWGRLQRPHSGAILMLLALFVPIILSGIKYTEYLFERRQKVLNTPKENGSIYKTCAKEAALAVAKEWNPALTFETQKEAAYKIADAIYNAAPAHQASALGAAIPGLSGTKESDLPASCKTIAVDASGKRTSAFGTPPVVVALENDRIKVTTDNDVAYAVPAQCNVDVVFAIPVNSDAKVSEISQACKSFLSDHFFYTRGVYASIVPYSGKLSIPASKSDWATDLPAYSASGNNVTLSALFATTGGIDASLTGGYTWNNTTCPIMLRKNKELFSSDAPEKSNNTKYQKMNLSPCYASPQSSKCEGACRSYSSNPYAITEPMINMAEFAEKFDVLQPYSDTYNKSNFVFMALEWANNMFQSWTAGSSAVSASSDTLSYPAKGGGGKKAIILIVNKPDHFEPGELTYLGFSNDSSQVLRESDVITDFSGANDRNYADGTSGKTVQGVKKLLSYRDEGSGNHTFTLSGRHTFKLRVEPTGSSGGTIKFTNISNNSNVYYKNSTTYKIVEKTDLFLLSDQIGSGNTVRLNVNNLIFKRAEMTDRAYSTTPATCTIGGTEDAPYIETNVRRPLKVKVTTTTTTTEDQEVTKERDVEVVEENSWAKINGETHNFTDKDEVKEFVVENATSSIGCELINSDLVSAELTGQKFFSEKLELKHFSSEKSVSFSCAVKKGTAEVNWDISSIKGRYVLKCNGEEFVVQKSMSSEIINNCNASIKKTVISTASNGDPHLLYNIKFNFSKNQSVVIEILGTALTSLMSIQHTIYITITNSETISLNSSNDNKITYASNALSFLGLGTLTVKVKPKTKVIKEPYTTTELVEVTHSSSEIISIDPDGGSYSYVKQSDGKYRISLPYKKSQLSDQKLDDTSPIYSLSELSVPSVTAGNSILGSLGKSVAGLTTEACTKLKAAGQAGGKDDFRLYLIKYCKDAGDYGYLDQCAGEGRGYEAGNADALKQKLDAIGEDIEKWTGRSEAMVVR